jgi:hypothetical protein
LQLCILSILLIMLVLFIVGRCKIAQTVSDSIEHPFQ